ncbi:MAG: hypothetical protein H0V48_04715 [Nocardioidaceae bacterium]|nr:hypothetical protein [Nocardioidaceae bacterium]MDQ3166367.1 hypothetical protein [Actinomycetota bacterium]
MPETSTTGYHANRAAVVTVLGVLTLCCGVGVLATAVLGRLRDGHGAWDAVFWSVLALTGLVGLLAVLAAVRLLRHSPVLILDDTGYRVRGLRGTGVRTAPWTEVTGVATAGGVVRIDLRHGGSTMLPTRLVEEPASVWVADVGARADGALPRRERDR